MSANQSSPKGAVATEIQKRLPLLPLSYYENAVRKTWTKHFVEDAEFEQHEVGWQALKSSAIELKVSLRGHVWNSHKSKLALAKKIVKAKVRDAGAEWSRKISTGLYEVL